MKKIIIGMVVAVAVVIPLHVSLVSAAENFFGDPGGSVDSGLRNPADESFFGSGHTSGYISNQDNLPFGYSQTPLYGDVFFGAGSSYNTAPIGTCDDSCYDVDPCEWDECDEYGDPCGYDCYADEDADTNESDNRNYNENNNETTIIIENYFDDYSYGSDSRSDRYRNTAPAFDSTPITIAQENQRYSYEAHASDRDGDVIEYQLLDSPAGMDIGRRTGSVNWIPGSTQGGRAHRVVIVASDDDHQIVQEFQIFVVDAASGATTRETQPTRSTGSQQSDGRVAGVSVVETAEASDKSVLRPFNIRVDTDELGNSVVTWDTSRPSRGRVLFGLASQGDRSGTDFTGAAQYEFATPNTPETSTSHRVILGQLEAERVYYFRVVSFIGEDIVVSTERSFVQLGDGQTLTSASMASALGSFGSFLLSPWFLFLLIIIVVLIIVFRRRGGNEIVAHAPVEMHTSVGHH